MRIKEVLASHEGDKITIRALKARPRAAALVLGHLSAHRRRCLTRPPAVNASALRSRA
jgi:hypothetical protein